MVLLVEPLSLDPAALARGDVPRETTYGAFPGEWSAYGIAGADARGFGTYRLRITGLDPSIRYALKLSSFQTSARVFADGRVIHLQGVPCASRELEVPGWASSVAPVGAAPDGTLDLVIHISNFADRIGGSRTSIRLGPYELVEQEAGRAAPYGDIHFFGALFVMGLY
jgi:hypothetical protein